VSDFISDTMLEFNFKISLVRLLDNTFIPSRIKVRAQTFITDDADEEKIEAAFVKIEYWLDRIVNRSIAFSQGNPSALEMLIDQGGINRTANMLMLTPDDPVDQLLAVLFQSKFTALSAGALTFGAVRVSSDNVAGLSFTYMGDNEGMLPTMEKWIGQKRSFFEVPWWERDDASTLDVRPLEDADLTKPPEWAYSLDFLLRADDEEDQKQPTILRPTFRPKIIDGGKKPD
jgi:hypothetical protein